MYLSRWCLLHLSWNVAQNDEHYVHDKHYPLLVRAE